MIEYYRYVAVAKDNMCVALRLSELNKLRDCDTNIVLEKAFSTSLLSIENSCRAQQCSSCYQRQYDLRAPEGHSLDDMLLRKELATEAWVVMTVIDTRRSDAHGKQH